MVLTLFAGLLVVPSVAPTPRATAAVSVPTVGRWSLDAGAGATATDSAGSHPLALGGGASWTSGVQGASALALDGTSTGTAATSGAVLTTSTSFSVSAYVKLTSMAGTQTFVSQDGVSVSAFALQFRSDTGRFGFSREDVDAAGSTTATAGSATAPVTGQWYHLTGVYSSTAATLALYVNDRLQSTVATSATFGTTGDFVVGRGRYGDSPSDFVTGAVDDVRAYSGALTAADVEQVSDAAFFRLDEGTGTAAADSGRTGTSATLVNGAGWVSGPLSLATDLDGINDYIDTNSSSVDTSKSFSVSAWARPDVVGSTGVVASLDGTNRSAFLLQLGSDGRWAFARPASDTAAAGTSTATATAKATAGAWYHLVAVYDSVAATVTLYVDGTKQAVTAYAVGWKGTGHLLLGRGQAAAAPTAYLDGAIDEVHVYPFVLDATTVTTLATPTAPPRQILPTATGTGTSNTLTWTANPIAASPTTSYVVTPYANNAIQTTQTFSGTTTSATFTTLIAGASYRYTVRAVNAVGDSGASAQSVAVLAANVPDAPPAPTATAGVLAATVSWTAPPENRSAIVGYRVTPYIGTTAQTPVVFASTATTQTVPGLTAATAYTFEVSARNGVGYGAASPDSNAVVPNPDRPATPAAPTATAAVTSAKVSWVAPAADGSTITTYVVTPYRGGTAQPATTFDASTTTRTMTGLVANAPYTFTVTAANGVGSSNESAPSSAVTPFTVTDAPAVTSVSAGTQRVTLTWSAPESTNGSAVTGYDVTPYIGTTAQTTRRFASTATTQVFTGLAAGTAYTFTVAARNAAGASAASALSSAVTPNAAPTQPAGNPPPAAVGSAYSSQLTVSGGTAPFVWSVTAGTLPAGLALSSSGLLSGTPSVTGSSTVTVRVVDASTVAASKSATITVADRPDTPATPTATADLGGAVVSWTPPAANSSTISAYVITPSLNGVAQSPVTVDPSATTRTLSGLTVGGVYSFTVAAVNAVGTSAASSASDLVTPYAALGAPGTPVVSAGSTSATLSWTAPKDTGGSPVTGYVVTPYVGTTPQTAWVFSSSATTQTVTGLTAGTAYTFKVAATNSSGRTVLYRDNVGGPQLASGDAGPVWASDAAGATRVNGGSTATWNIPVVVDSTVPSTTPAALFTTQRYDPGTRGDGAEMSWSFPVAGGTPVRVRLYFENGNSGYVAGQRVFDVAVEGAPVLDAFDPVVAAGGNQRGTMREFPVTSDGAIDIAFAHNPNDPILSGVEIIQTSAATTGPPSSASSAVTPNPNPTLTFAAPPPGVVGTAYSTQLTATGGTTPVTWSVASGTLPAGIGLSSGGLLSGTPTSVGSSTFTVQAVDASGQSATRPVTLVVTARPDGVVAPTATAGVTSAAVSWTAPTDNGSAITGYVVTPYLSGRAQTAVLLDASSTTRTLTGLTAGGSYTFTVAAVNADGTGAASPPSGAVIVYDVPAAPSIATSTAGDGRVTLSWTAPATNGSAITGYVVTPFIGATAQDATSFSGTGTTRTVTGLTPGTTYTFKVAALNVGGTGAQSASSSAVTPNADPTLTLTGLPAGEVGVAYTSQLPVVGGTAPFTWSVTSGTLPPGLSLSSSGLLAGNPTAAGSSTCTVQVTDADGQSASRSLTQAISAAPSLTFTPAAGQVGVPYSQQPTLSGGTGPIAWTLTAGSLPVGVTLDASTGLVSGTPTADGTFPVTVRATDRFGQAADRSVSIVIDATVLGLRGLTRSFTVSGPPGSTVALDDAVVGTVVTNSIAGYTVSVRAVGDAFRSQSGSTDTIPVESLTVREHASDPYQRLSPSTAVPVYSQAHASAPGGDTVRTDYQVQIPYVDAGTYSVTVQYVVSLR